jgi:tRNA nucleotidyltransferase (CCA-adding enzyme)
MRDEKIERLSHVEKIYNDIMLKEQCVSLRTLKVTGNDLMDIGVPKGRAIGEMLNALLEDVLENPEDNSRDILIQKAINMME